MSAGNVNAVGSAAGSVPHVHLPYHYVPNQHVAIIMLICFGISTFLHFGQSCYYRTWWMIPTAFICGILELTGWSARLWSSFSPSLNLPFTIQMTATIIGPTPLVAANFMILGKIIMEVGTEYSRLTPKLYSLIFCGCDIISLVVQALGGAMASKANSNNGNPDNGGHVMLGGILFQTVTVTVYIFLALEFFMRYFKDIPIRPVYDARGKPINYRVPMETNVKLMSLALVFNTVCLYIRSLYRAIELSNGWNGRIIRTQVYFNVLDGAMIVLAIWTLNFAHPGRLLRDPGKQAEVESSLGMSRTNLSDSTIV